MKALGVVQSLFLNKAEPVLIDLGSSYTRIYLGKKEAFNGATCIAVHTNSESVVAVGNKALQLLGKTPDSVEISFPVLNGEVAHTRYLELFLTAVLKEALSELNIQRGLFGLTAKVAIPNSLSPAKKNLLKGILKTVGFNKITFIGSGFIIAKNIAKNDSKLRDICVLDIGAQKSEISIFSLGELVYAQSYRWGGVFLTESLQKIVRSKHNCVVGWHVAEDAKKEIGSFVTTKEKLAIRGKDLVSQASKTVIIDSTDIKGEFSKLLDELLDDIQQFISLLPSEVAISVLDKGIYLTGGTSQIEGIDQAVIEKFKCDVLVSTRPQMDVIIGLQAL